MVQRGFGEAREAARFERRQTELSRQLSSFLADASLALDASQSLEEMLRLVAEQARELVECTLLRRDCRAARSAARAPRPPPTTTTGAGRRSCAGSTCSRSTLYFGANGGSIRLGGEQLTQLFPFRTAASRGRPLDGWLAASLTALDGSDLGAVQLFDKEDGAFTGDDEAVLLHLAQMASAAVERTRLYERP